MYLQEQHSSSVGNRALRGSVDIVQGGNNVRYNDRADFHCLRIPAKQPALRNYGAPT